MHRRTFEIIGKWIAHESDVRIKFNAPVPCPMANPKEKIILLPDISSANALAGICDIMHEAGHIRWSNKLPTELAASGASKEILNVMEDIRIDNKCLKILPNIKEFYAESWKSDQRPKAEATSKEFRVLVNAIANATGFAQYGYKDQETISFENKIDGLQLANELYEGTVYLERGDWEGAKRAINNVRRRLKMKEDKSMKVVAVPSPGSSKDKNKQKEGQEKSQGQGEGDKEQEEQADGGDNPIKGVGDLMHGGRRWGTGHLDGASTSQFDEATLEQMTIERLKQLLNITEIELIEDGNSINTDNLIAYFTGAVDELFEEEIIQRKKKSKIMFLLDASGSMDGQLYDHTSQLNTVGECVTSITKILDEVISIEGIDVSYCVRFFSDDYIKPTDEKNWSKDYTTMGGTSIGRGFTGAMDELCSDNNIDGKRIIICITDGEVNPADLDEVKRLAYLHAADIRVVFIGVGMTPTCRMAKELVGDNIILTKDQTNEVLLEAVTQAL